MKDGIRVLVAAAALGAWASTGAIAAEPAEQVLFVCQHGNVKSVMAAAYFNQLAAERKLPLRAIARGLAVDSASVPQAIADGLRGEGLDVSDVTPAALSARDRSASQHVVMIGGEAPAPLRASNAELWADVPPASTNYPAASQSLRAHVAELIERLVSAKREN